MPAAATAGTVLMGMLVGMGVIFCPGGFYTAATVLGLRVTMAATAAALGMAMFLMMFFMSMHNAPFRQLTVFTLLTLHLGADSRVKPHMRIIAN
ncbi:hypothetical protein YERSI8AC_10243 [Enterobacterales bacterium 8AC]|nr:hypothetical protein YERSI8AC_10243 [Enterobacterales bacterium 8AC]